MHVLNVSEELNMQRGTEKHWVFFYFSIISCYLLQFNVCGRNDTKSFIMGIGIIVMNHSAANQYNIKIFWKILNYFKITIIYQKYHGKSQGKESKH